MRNVTIVSWTAAAVVWKTRSICGIAGKYMSMEMGANACSRPSQKSNSRCPARGFSSIAGAVATTLNWLLRSPVGSRVAAVLGQNLAHSILRAAAAFTLVLHRSGLLVARLLGYQVALLRDLARLPFGHVTALD